MPRMNATLGGSRCRRSRVRVLLLALLALALVSAAAGVVCSAAGAQGAVLDVRDYGAVGDGRHDDTTAFQHATTAAVAHGRPLSVPAGVYFVHNLILPDGLTLVGDGWRSSWIKGRVLFGSRSQIAGLKIGALGVEAVRNREGARDTRFLRCRFRGGSGPKDTYVVDLGSGRSCDHITFESCLVERNLGRDPDATMGYNDITILVDHGRAVRNVTFVDCRVGVSNGRRTGRSIGAPRMGIECYTTPDSPAGWSNVTLRDCIFEAADFHTADFSDTPQVRSTGLLIEGCTFKGGGYANGRWKYVLDLEMPLAPVIRDNLFLRGRGTWGYVINVTDRGDRAYAACDALISGNTFDLDKANGIRREHAGWPFVFIGTGNRFIGNRIKCHYGFRSLVVLDGASSSVVTGNVFDILKRPLILPLRGASGNTLAPNEVR